MTFCRSLLVMLLVPFLGTIHAQSINTAASSIAFTVGNMKIFSVHGTFSGLTGTVSFDAAAPATAKFDVCIDAGTVDTGNQKRDKDLRSDRFFDAATYPAICYTSTAVEKRGASYLAKGKLTMHGITKEVEIPFSVEANTLTGTFTVNRLDYGVGAGIGTFMAGDEVEVTVVSVLQ